MTSFRCPICFGSNVESFVRLPHCKHSFCKSCICEWMEQSLTCPLCRDGICVGEQVEIKMQGVELAQDSMERAEVVSTLDQLMRDHQKHTREIGRTSLRTLLPIFLFLRYQGGDVLAHQKFRRVYIKRLQEALRLFPEMARYKLRLQDET